ncbi:MAG: hypothetical protein Q7K33_01790 [Candidatus Berkelbacteria bacterium]|nr:hypothetical protein [Candidatus Berkelbacteria bacterium]
MGPRSIETTLASARRARLCQELPTAIQNAALDRQEQLAAHNLGGRPVTPVLHRHWTELHPPQPKIEP